MTPDEAKEVLEKVKKDLPNWEVVLNVTNSEETVRNTVLYQLLKRFYRAAGRTGEDVFTRPGESYEEAITRFVLAATGSYYPSREELEEVIVAAFTQRNRWQSDQQKAP